MSKKELNKFGAIGRNVLISKNAKIFGHKNVYIGNNVRIDADCIIQAVNGQLNIGNYVHIATKVTFVCAGWIFIYPFAQIASNCTLLSASDDFSGKYLVGPMIPDEFRNVYKGKITVGLACVIGASCVILPGTRMKSGSALACLSSTKKDQILEEDKIYGGTPATPIKDRSVKHYSLIKEFSTRNARTIPGV